MSSGILGRLKSKRQREEQTKKESDHGDRGLALSTSRPLIQKSSLVVCSTTIETTSPTHLTFGDTISRPWQTLIEANKREKRERFGHTRCVVHFTEAYVNREKVEELNKLSTTEA